MDSKECEQRDEKKVNSTTTCQTSSTANPGSPKHEDPKTTRLMNNTNKYQGPYQDDSTLAVLSGLRTVPARFLLWFNLPFCWLVGIAIATRLIDGWLDAHFSGPEATVAIVFVVVYAVYTILAHTLGVFCGLGYELWRNPYARAPTLRGEVGREEEVAMLKENRLMARRICRCFLPWKA